ncbi:hypothetical protein ACR1PO_15600 [Chryseobacterium sp. RRHN12]|uniref:hypothetical protein n=1 Tax=Chryseobacterium sp. RRHN12 TaxID=3437884 RepID=UPI003D9AD34A
MSHQEKQSIFDEYAKSQGYLDWSDLKADCDENLMTEDEFSLFMFEACDLIQAEQQKRIAEKEETISGDDFYFSGVPVDKIINPENKIQ